MDDDEFRFLAGDARRVGRPDPIPEVRRVGTELSDGRRVSGLSWRPGPPPEVVLLHGAGLNAHGFDPMLLALDTDASPVPALALDLPGHGRSDWRADATYSPDRLADDVGEALAAMAPGPVTLLGHSLGGMTAALVAAAHPGRVERLVIVDLTPGFAPQRDATAVSEFIAGQRDFADIDEVVDRAVRFGIGSDRASLARGVALNTRRRADGRLEWAHHLAHLAGLPSASSDAARPYAEVWGALDRVDVPVTLVTASRGMVGPALLAEWCDRVPSAHVIEIDGPHNLHEAAPVELARAVSQTLGR